MLVGKDMGLRYEQKQGLIAQMITGIALIRRGRSFWIRDQCGIDNVLFKELKSFAMLEVVDGGLVGDPSFRCWLEQEMAPPAGCLNP